MEPREIFGYDVIDRNGNRIGDVNAVWIDETTGRPELVAVKTGWLGGRHHVVPVFEGEIDAAGEAIRVPFEGDVVKDAPTFEPDHDLTPGEEAEVYSYYGVERSIPAAGGPLPGATEAEVRAPLPAEREAALPERRTAGAEREAVEMPLYGENVRVGKETVERGAVRLRKVVKTETVDQPVTLRKEEIHVERIPPGELAREPGDVRPFQEEEVVLREHEERPVVEKTREIVGGVRAEKEVETERETVHATRQREDFEVDRVEGGEETRRS